MMPLKQVTAPRCSLWDVGSAPDGAGVARVTDPIPNRSSPSTVSGSILAGLGAMPLHPADGLMQRVTRDTRRAWLLRRLTPFVVGILLLLGGLVLQGERRGAFGNALVVASFGLLVIAMLLGLIRWAAQILSQRHIVHQQTEDTLRESEARFRTLVESIPQSISLKDRNSRWVFINENFARDIGVRPEDVVGKVDYDFFPREIADKYRAGDRRVMETGVAEEFDERSVYWEREIQVHCIKAPVKDRRGEVIGIFAILRDITERQRAEAALQASEVRYRRLFEAAQDGVLILDAETGSIVDANPFVMERLHYTHDELLGKKLWEIGLFADLAANEAAFVELQRDKYIRYDDLPLKTRGGRSIAVEFVSNVYEVDHQKVIQCNIRDITARKQAEAQRVGLEDQIRQQQRLETVGQLAAGVAHDFNNILTGITGYGQFAHDATPEGSVLREDLAEVLRLAGRAADLTRQLLAFSRKQTLQPVVLNVNQLVNDLVKMLRRLLGEHLNLKCRLAGDLAAVKADPGQLEQVLINLAVNARDAMQGGGRLTIETANAELDEAYAGIHTGVLPGLYVMLAVSDNGCGMDASTREHIFEPFFTTKGIGKGTGLGLSTVHGIVKQHGGHIWVYSEPGRGTTFKVYLPRVSETTEERPAIKPKDLPTGTETILILEDDDAVRQVAARILMQQGYHVLTATLPSLADEMLEAHGSEIALLLTDVVMPERSGRLLYESAHARYPHLRVLYMSGYTDDAALSQGLLDAGAAFIEKPFTTGALLNRVGEVLGGKDDER